MAKSYKKPWGKHIAGHWRKKLHSRRMRRVVSQKLDRFKRTARPEWRSDFWMQVYDFDFVVDTHWMQSSPEPLIPHSHEVSNPCDVWEYRSYWDVPQNRRK